MHDAADAEIRQANPAEEGALLDLWCTVFDQPEWVFTRNWRAYPPDRRLSLVACQNGKLVASVQTYFAQVASPAGGVWQVAAIANVSTLPAARRRGLSTLLLEKAIEAARDRACAFSLLFTGTPDFYAKLGYRKVDRAQFTVDLVPSWPCLSPVQADMGAMTEAYAAAHRATPLMLRRTDADWLEHVVPGLEGSLVFQTSDGYLTGRVEGEIFDVGESACPNNGLALYQGAFGWASAQGCKRAKFFGPLPAGLEELVEASVREQSWFGMALPLSPILTQADLQGLFTGTHSGFSPLDSF